MKRSTRQNQLTQRLARVAELYEMVEDDFKHWLTPKIRLAIYSFFMKHFGITGDPAEADVELLTADELKVTTTGQVSTSLGGKMIFDVNKDETESTYTKYPVSKKGHWKPSCELCYARRRKYRVLLT